MLRYNFVDQQSGAALLVTIIVLLGLTVLALASTSSNQTQQLLLRANQENLLVFNAGMSEIDAQITQWNMAASNESPSPVFTQMIKEAEQGSPGVSTFDLAVLVLTGAELLKKEVTLAYLGHCASSATTAGVQPGILRCDRFELKVVSYIDGTAIRSEQSQTLSVFSESESLMDGDQIEMSLFKPTPIFGWVERVVWTERTPRD